VNVLRAYPTLLRVGLASAVAYRAEMIVWMLTTTMPLVSLALWSAVAAIAPVGRFERADFVAYFLATVVVRQLSSSWVVWELIQDIKSGALSTRLLKPIHPLLGYSAESLAALPIRAALTLPVAAIALSISRNHFVVTPSRLAAFALSMVGAWLITFFVMAIVGTLSFFIESSSSIFEIWLMSFMLLSGYLIPLELFPPWARTIAYLLPFRYTLGFPVELLTGMIPAGGAPRGLAIQWIYVLVSFFGALSFWRAGLRRFGAFGG
jgi:ABC-2 type transport system permease protein